MMLELVGQEIWLDLEGEIGPSKVKLVSYDTFGVTVEWLDNDGNPIIRFYPVHRVKYIQSLSNSQVGTGSRA